MNCHDAKERIAEGRETAGVRRHLAHCEDCSLFVREIADGGRDLAEAFLAVSPSPGFEDRVAGRMVEEEITVPIPLRSTGRLTALLVPALLVLLAVVAYRLLEPPPAPRPAATAPRPTRVRPGAVTEPRRENVLTIALRRADSAGPTLMDTAFAGEKKSVRFPGEVEDFLLRAWVRGARRVRLVVSQEVPTRELWSVIEVLEMAGFSFEVVREKDLPAPAGRPAR